MAAQRLIELGMPCTAIVAATDSLALGVLEVMQAEDVPARAAAASSRLGTALGDLPRVASVRGMGLLLAAELHDRGSAREVTSRALRHGLVVNAVTPSAIRLEPSLLVSDGEIDEAVAILAAVIHA
jgi:acetylornithine/N-succinyldiaminopimelate aminotransferase